MNNNMMILSKKRSQTQCSYVTLLRDIIDEEPSKKYLRRKGRSVPVQEELCLGCSIET